MSQEQALAIPSKETPGSLSRSELLRRSVNAKVLQVEQSIVKNKLKRAETAAGEREVIKKGVQVRIKENTAASRAAETCVKSIDDSVKETGLWITKLHHERYKQFAAQKVCERRLELREANPPDMAKDSLQEALESEHKTLRLARTDFLKLEVEVKKVVEDLQAIRCNLSLDAAHRRMAVSADTVIMVALAMAGAVAPGAKSEPEGEKVVHAVGSLADSRLCCQKSEQLEDVAGQLRRQSKLLIFRVKDECGRAQVRVESRLTKRTEETLEVTKKLIGQGKEVDYTIEAAQRSLLANHKFLDKKDKGQEFHYQSSLKVLEELKRSRSDLTTDLRKKTILLNTSEACRKVTPCVASSPPPARLVKARPGSAGTIEAIRPRAKSGTSSAGAKSPAHLPSLAPEGMKSSQAWLPGASESEVQSPTSFAGGMEDTRERPANDPEQDRLQTTAAEAGVNVQ